MLTSKCNDCNAAGICKGANNNNGFCSASSRESYVLYCKYYKSINDYPNTVILPFDKDHVKPEYFE